jgi:Icc-related predicted phosphoesterase
MDPLPLQKQLKELRVNLHKKREVIGETTFIGYGGSNHTPFSTPFEVPESTIQTDLDELCQPIPSLPWVLVTHAPPHNTRIDRTGKGIHVGSEAIRYIIKKYNPTIAISGHIHEAMGIDNLSQTILVNPGPAYDQNAAIVEIQKKEAVVKLIKV